MPWNCKQQRAVTGFVWNAEADEAFKRAKQGICETILHGGSHQSQHHLATDASDIGAGEALIQLSSHPPGSKLTGVPCEEWSIAMFMSLHFSEVEVKYHITESEFYAGLLCLTECQWLVISRPSPLVW